jgi:hypothetical protein
MAEVTLPKGPTPSHDHDDVYIWLSSIHSASEITLLQRKVDDVVERQRLAPRKRCQDLLKKTWCGIQTC